MIAFASILFASIVFALILFSSIVFAMVADSRRKRGEREVRQAAIPEKGTQRRWH
jgi:hypothetical protein